MRGMLESTVVLVMGEFGRGPRINQGLPNDKVPGRDHWGEVMSVLVAGGGFAQGHLIGASNARGEVPKDCPVTPQDLLVTLYRQMGIDPETQLPEPRRPADLDRIDGADHQGTLLTRRDTRRTGPTSPDGSLRPPVGRAVSHSLPGAQSPAHNGDGPHLSVRAIAWEVLSCRARSIRTRDPGRCRAAARGSGPGRVHLQRGGAVHGQLVDVGGELVLAVEHLVVGDDLAGVGGHAAHRR